MAQIFSTKALATEWDESQKAMPSGDLFLFTPDFIAKYCDIIGLEFDAIPYLQSVADQIKEIPDLVRLAWHFHYLMFQSKTYMRGDSRNFPSLDTYLGNGSGAFYLIIALSGIPKAQGFHKGRNIPEKVMLDTYSDTAIWARDYKDLHGVWGMDTNVLPWLYNHLCGDLYRLVRLQFIQRSLGYRLKAFRNRLTRKVIVLAYEGITYRKDGQLDGTGEIYDPENRWTSRLLLDQDKVTGTPIHPNGFALCEEVTLPLDTWECILSPGDPILEVHIPTGSRMDFGDCGDSFHQAIDFFPRYFPDRPFRAFCCGSWLLNTQFQGMLPSDSNIVRFQREFYLFPILSGSRSGLDRIFRNGVKDITKAPRDTTLRRVVLDHLQAGGYLRGGGGLIFPEVLDWGTRVYHRQFSVDTL
ncbi:MAG: acyltransferase domain-containing protein [Candidatus Poribacteria bacterium]